MKRMIRAAAALLCLFVFVSCGSAPDIVITPATAEVSPSRLIPETGSGGAVFSAETAAELILIEDTEAAPEPETAAETEPETAEETGTVTAAPDTTAAETAADTTEKPPETAPAPETAAPPETTAAAPVTSPPETEAPVPADEAGGTLVTINTSSRKYHTHPECPYAAKMNAANRVERRISAATLERSGYTICSWCAKQDEKPETAVAERTVQQPAKTEPVRNDPAPAAPQETKKTAAQAASELISTLRSGGIHIVLNVNSGTYHTSDGCSYAAKIKAENRLEAYIADTSALDAAGYKHCSYCAKAGAKPETAPPETAAPEETAAPPEPAPVPAPAPEPETPAPPADMPAAAEMITVIINKNSKTFHISESCSAAASMKEENKQIVQVEGEAGILGLIAQGYKPCGRCAKAYGGG